MGRYVNLVLHLNKKTPRDYSGVESFVMDCLDSSSLAWLPAKTSFHIQAAGKRLVAPAKGGGGGGGGGKERLKALLSGVGREVAGLRKDVGGLDKQLGRLEVAHGDSRAAPQAAVAKKADGAGD